MKKTLIYKKYIYKKKLKTKRNNKNKKTKISKLRKSSHLHKSKTLKGGSGNNNSSSPKIKSISCNSTQIVSYNENNEIQLWNIENNNYEILEISENKVNTYNASTKLVINDDGSKIAIIQNNKIKIFNLKGEREGEVYTIKTDEKAYTNLAFNNEYLLCASFENELSIWNTIDGTLIESKIFKSLFGLKHIITCLAFNPLNSNIIAIGVQIKTITKKFWETQHTSKVNVYLFDISTKKTIDLNLSNENNTLSKLNSIAFHPNGKQLILSYEFYKSTKNNNILIPKNKIELWGVNTNKNLEHLEQLKQLKLELSKVKKNDLEEIKKLKNLEFEKNKKLEKLEKFVINNEKQYCLGCNNHHINNISFSPDGNFIAGFISHNPTLNKMNYILLWKFVKDKTNNNVSLIPYITLELGIHSCSYLYLEDKISTSVLTIIFLANGKIFNVSVNVSVSVNILKPENNNQEFKTYDIGANILNCNNNICVIDINKNNYKKIENENDDEN